VQCYGIFSRVRISRLVDVRICTHPDINQTAYTDAWKNTITLHVQDFLRMYKTCRRQYKLIKSLNEKSMHFVGPYYVIFMPSVCPKYPVSCNINDFKLYSRWNYTKNKFMIRWFRSDNKFMWLINPNKRPEIDCDCIRVIGFRANIICVRYWGKTLPVTNSTVWSLVTILCTTRLNVQKLHSACTVYLCVWISQ